MMAERIKWHDIETEEPAEEYSVMLAYEPFESDEVQYCVAYRWGRLYFCQDGRKLVEGTLLQWANLKDVVDVFIQEKALWQEE